MGEIIIKELQEIWLCEDCLMPAVYDDYSGLDYYYQTDVVEKRYIEIQAGLIRLGVIYPGDVEEEFSRCSCDCCNSPLHGKRYQFFQEVTK